MGPKHMYEICSTMKHIHQALVDPWITRLDVQGIAHNLMLATKC